MKNIVHIYAGPEEMKNFFSESGAVDRAPASTSVLVQIFSAATEMNVVRDITGQIYELIPDAEIVGVTSVGEIADGELQLGKIILSITFFEKTHIYCRGCHCPKGEEFYSGQKLLNEIKKLGEDVAGVLLLATTLTLDMSKIFQGVASAAGDISIPVFGGGAGVYDETCSSWVLYDNEFYDRGIVMVVFIGKMLQITVDYNFGWQSLGKTMKITKSEGMIVNQVDETDAFELYHRYLNIRNDSTFFQNVLEFPFMVERDGYSIARVPFFAHDDNSIEFVADIIEGENFRLGYGDPDSIIDSAKKRGESMKNFKPDVIFLFACICRRFLMQSDVNQETKIFGELAPTSGFFTCGEFFVLAGKVQILNSTIVIVGMKENTDIVRTERQEWYEKQTDTIGDVYSGKHNRIVSRLLYFISSLSAELEAANKELLKISELDKITQVSNRWKLDQVIQNEVLKSISNEGTFSIILADVDFFKTVNDRFGHLAGDHVLMELSRILRENVRSLDMVGRWGGEEFMIILPSADSRNAVAIAEKLRQLIERYEFIEDYSVTCSFGVSDYRKMESVEELIQRVDKALYIAKERGKNRVVEMDTED